MESYTQFLAIIIHVKTNKFNSLPVLFYSTLHEKVRCWIGVRCKLRWRINLGLYVVGGTRTETFVVAPDLAAWGFTSASAISQCLFFVCVDSDGSISVNTLSSPISFSSFKVWSDIILIFGCRFKTAFPSEPERGLSLPFFLICLFDFWSLVLVLFSGLSCGLLLSRDDIQPMMTLLMVGDIYHTYLKTLTDLYTACFGGFFP